MWSDVFMCKPEGFCFDIISIQPYKKKTRGGYPWAMSEYSSFFRSSFSLFPYSSPQQSCSCPVTPLPSSKSAWSPHIRVSGVSVTRCIHRNQHPSLTFRHSQTLSFCLTLRRSCLSTLCGVVLQYQQGTFIYSYK